MRGRILGMVPSPLDSVIGRAGEFLISETESIELPPAASGSRRCLARLLCRYRRTSGSLMFVSPPLHVFSAKLSLYSKRQELEWPGGGLS